MSYDPFFSFNVEEVIAELLLNVGSGINLAEVVDETQLAIIGVAGARGVKAQRKESGDLLRGGKRMRVIIDGITLGPSGIGSISVWKLLVGGLVGTLGRLFGLALEALGCLFWRSLGLELLLFFIAVQ